MLGSHQAWQGVWSRNNSQQGERLLNQKNITILICKISLWHSALCGLTKRLQHVSKIVLFLFFQVLDEVPVDEGALQAMSIAWRELQQPEKICKMYEGAVKKEPSNEDFLSHLFMSYVRFVVLFCFLASNQIFYIFFLGWDITRSNKRWQWTCLKQLTKIPITIGQSCHWYFRSFQLFAILWLVIKITLTYFTMANI